MVPNLRFIGLCDRGTLRRVRLCLTTPANVHSGGNSPYTEQEHDDFGSSQYSWVSLYMKRFPDHKNTYRLKKFTGSENKHTKILARIVKQRYGGKSGLDLDPKCFYSGR